jgi:AraC-like DNA-binding protein
MKLLLLKTNLYSQTEETFPFNVYTVGTEEQSSMIRLKGFSANHLFLTFSGMGMFRTLGQEHWDIIRPNTLLYIPSELPHEYLPYNHEPWCVGYVTFVENQKNILESWGFGKSPIQFELQDMDRLDKLLEEIWKHSGPQHDVWCATGHFFSFCLELKKQRSLTGLEKPVVAYQEALRHRDSVVDSAIRFLHDHLQRNISLTELSSHVGYSPKQLNRLFQQSIGSTPLQYLQGIRLQTAALLLKYHPRITINQAAAHIGMEAVYFTRLFRRRYGLVPSEFRKQDDIAGRSSSVRSAFQKVDLN